MLPIQILINNLMYDFSQAAIPPTTWTRISSASPGAWRIDDIKRYILFLGPVSSVFDYLTFFIMLHVFNAWDNPALFQTGWFIESSAVADAHRACHPHGQDSFLPEPLQHVPGHHHHSHLCGRALAAVLALANAFNLVVPPGSYWLLLGMTIFCYMCPGADREDLGGAALPARRGLSEVQNEGAAERVGGP